MNTRKVKKPLNRVLLLVWIVWGLLTLGGMAALILNAVNRVQSGNGLEIYRTKWLVEDTSLGFLIFLAASVTALIIGGFFHFKEWLEIRKLEKKYPASDK